MRRLLRYWERRSAGRSARRGFTFIELVVAVALSIVLLRGMYTIFNSATRLARLSEQQMVTVFEGSAVFDYLAGDVARSPSTTSDYYLELGADRKSITFQATRLDGLPDTYVYVQYYLDETSLMRKVLGSDRATVATEAADAEDGSVIKVGHNITNFQAYYFNNSKAHLEAAGAWDLTDTLTGADRTWAVRFDITIEDTDREEGLQQQTFSPVFMIAY